MRRHRNLQSGLFSEHLVVTSELVVLFLLVREHRLEVHRSSNADAVLSGK